MKLDAFVHSWENNIENVVKPNAKPSEDPYVNFESEITVREANQLIEKMKTCTVDVNKETLAPFIQFLTDRWERVKGTPADYASSPESLANQLSKKLAQAIARNILGKRQVSAEEAKPYYEVNDAPERTQEEGKSKLRESVAVRLSMLFASSDELIKLMTRQIDSRDWNEFITCCNLDKLKDLFLGAGYISQHKNMYDAITELATSETFYGGDIEENKAKLYCLIEIYKRQRSLDPEYTSFGGWVTGIGGHRRISQADCLQEYLTSEEKDFKVFGKNRPKDIKSISSSLVFTGHMNVLATQAEKIKTALPKDLNLRPSALERKTA